MQPPMLHTAYKVTTTRNAYGDYTASGSTALKCHFRHITALSMGETNEAVECDALAWFEPDSGVTKGTVINFEGVHYIVERFTQARRLRSPEVQFIKTELIKYGTIS